MMSRVSARNPDGTLPNVLPPGAGARAGAVPVTAPAHPGLDSRPPLPNLFRRLPCRGFVFEAFAASFSSGRGRSTSGGAAGSADTRRVVAGGSSGRRPATDPMSWPYDASTLAAIDMIGRAEAAFIRALGRLPLFGAARFFRATVFVRAFRRGFAFVATFGMTSPVPTTICAPVGAPFLPDP